MCTWYIFLRNTEVVPTKEYRKRLRQRIGTSYILSSFSPPLFSLVQLILPTEILVIHAIWAITELSAWPQCPASDQGQLIRASYPLLHSHCLLRWSQFGSFLQISKVQILGQINWSFWFVYGWRDEKIVAASVQVPAVRRWATVTFHPVGCPRRDSQLVQELDSHTI